MWVAGVGSVRLLLRVTGQADALVWVKADWTWTKMTLYLEGKVALKIGN